MKKVVITSGYFNPLHIGHLNLLKESKTIGDYLIVIVNNDKQSELKHGFTFMPEAERVEIIKSLNPVDEVFLSVDDYAEGEHVPITKSLKLLALKYSDAELFFAKGGDRNSDNIPESEKKVCQDFNIKIVNGVGGKKVQSSSWLIKNIAGRII